jgi:hypothetical protein
MELEFWNNPPALPSIVKYPYDDLGDAPHLHVWRAFWNGDAGILLQAYPVIRMTPCGLWIAPHAWRSAGEWMGCDKTRWIGIKSRSAWAKPTQDDALRSISIRLLHWTSRLSGEVEKAKTACDILGKVCPQFAERASDARKQLLWPMQ